MFPMLASARRKLPLATLIGLETFSRDAANGTTYGSADTGGAATLNNTTQLALTGGQLVITATSASAARTATYAVTAADIDIVDEWQISAIPAANHTIAAVGRSISQSEQLRGKVVIDSTGAIKVQGFYIVPLTPAGTGNVGTGDAGETSIAASVLVSRLGTVVPAQKYLRRMQVQGTAMRLKVWSSTEAEPVGWDWTGTQGFINAAGSFGWRVVAPSATPYPVVKIDNITTRQLPGRVPLMAAYAPAVAAVVAGVTTLAAAVAAAPDGSTITTTGDFYENFTIPVNKFLTLQSVPANSTTIRGDSATIITTGWTNEGGGVFSYFLGYQCHGVLFDGRPLLKFTTLANLQNAKFGDGVTAACPEGFFANATHVYVRRQGDTSPNGAEVRPTRSGVTATGAAGTAITMGNGSHLTLLNIGFKNWPNRAVFVGEQGAYVNAVLCDLGNNKTGLEDSTSTDVETNHIYALGCEYYMCGPHDPALLYNGPWAIRKALGKDAQGTASDPDGIYTSNLSGRMIKTTCDDLRIEQNYIHDVFDCIEAKGRFTATDYGLANRTSYIRNNTFHRYVDNACEHDSATKYMYIDIYNNVFIDGFVTLSVSTFLAGQVDFHHNLLVITDQWYADGTNPKTNNNTISKILKAVSAGGFNNGTMATINVNNNTILLGRSVTQHGQIYETKDPQDAFDYPNLTYKDNITVCYRSQKWELSNAVLHEKNLIWHGGTATEFTAANFRNANNGGSANIFGGDSRDKRPANAVLGVNPQLGSTPATFFKLQVGSPCIGAGTGGTDLGAIPFGTEWVMPQVGLGATLSAYRPPLSATIASAATYWMGL